MSNYFIPSILAAVVLIAGIFAISPVQEASTVRTTIQANSIQIANIATTPAGFDPTDDDILTVTGTSAFQVLGMTCINIDPEAAENPIALTTRIGSANTATAGAVSTTTNDPATSATDPGTRTNMFAATAAGSYFVPAGESLFFEFGTLTDDGGGNEDFDCRLTVLAQSDDTITAVFTAE